MKFSGYEKGVGDSAEQQAANYLLGLGWTIVTRQFRVKGGEIDIIALEDDVLIFIEVKARTTSTPEDALSAKKAGSIRNAARQYLMQNGLEDVAHRFDFIALQGSDLRHVRGSF